VSHVRVIADHCPIVDNVNAVCGGCERPELFCACPTEIKRQLAGFDDY
jgi:hypothetical protein